MEQGEKMGVEHGKEGDLQERRVGRTLGGDHLRKMGFADFMLLNYQEIQNVRANTYLSSEKA